MSSRPVRPPVVAAWLLRWLTPPGDRPFLCEDAREEFERIAAADGRAAARSWYWSQALSSVRPLAHQRGVSATRRLSLRSLPFHAWLADLSQAARWIRRHPATAVTVWATLTAAFGTALATFSIINAVALRPLPFASPDRIVSVRVTGPTLARSVRSSSRPDYEDWKDRMKSFAALSAWASLEFRLTGRGEPRQVEGARVARDFDTVLGVKLIAGRPFGEADYAPPAPQVVLITHAFWRSEFASSPAALGQLLTLDGRPYEIVGVLPDLDLQFPLAAHDFWLPLIPRVGAFWEHSRGTGWLSVVGRVRDDLGIAAAEAELSALARANADQYPSTNRGKTTAELTPIRDDIIGPVTPMLTLLGAGLASILLIACGNIANLLLASISSRRREFAVRAAIGAAGTRLARQVMSETMLLAAAAAIGGLLVSPLFVKAFLAIYPGTLPRAVAPGIGIEAVLGSLVLAALGTLLLGVPQALHARRSSIGRDISGVTRTTSPSRDGTFRASLVTAQVALSFVLIVAGVGFVRTLNELQRVNTGYSPDGVLAFTLPPPTAQGSGASALQFYNDIIETIASIPGVQAAAASVAAPMMTGGWAFGIRQPGATVDTLVGVNLTTPGYFDVLGVQLLQGRLLTAEEQRRGREVVVVNEPLSRILGGDVVGKRLAYSGTNWEIVGVVRGVRRVRPRDEPAPELIIPWHNAGRRPQTILVRTAGDPLALLPIIAARIHTIDPTAPISDAGRLEDKLSEALAAERFSATLLAALAAVAVALAALGAYSVTAYAVARRTREYGIRLALGEHTGSIRRKALAAAVLPAGLGVVCGAGIAVASARWLESFLYQVSGIELTTMLVAGLGLLMLALIAGSSSARRAAAIDPARILAAD